MHVLRNRHHSFSFWIVLLLTATAATFVLAACGGQTSSTQPSPTTAATSTSASTPTSSATAVKVVQVKMVEKNDKYSFEPATITIPKGAEVMWTNTSDAPHTVTSDTNAFGTTSNLTQNQTFKMTFNTAGTYAYHCNIHPYMKATITVTS